MTVPGRPALAAGFFLLLIFLGAAVEPGLVWIGCAGDLIIIGACLLEGRRLARLPIDIRREDPERLQVGREAQCVFRIDNRGGRAAVVAIRQPWPASFESADGPAGAVEVRVGPRESVRVALAATPLRRGRQEIPPAGAHWRSVTGLAARKRLLEPAAPVTVYPALEGLREYDILRRHRALSRMGIHRIRQVGGGREFELLREYLPDDDFRDINWKATARLRRPITNVHQAERSQDVLLCLDCGRMMGNPVGSGTALDRAVDAAILLAHAAGRQGDRVGLALFQDTVQRFLQPKAGSLALHRIIDELAGAAPEAVFPSYAALVSALRTRHKRRSMIFLFTDLNDPQLAENMTAVLPLISRRHVVVVVSLRDALLDRAADGAPASAREVYRMLAARRLVEERSSRTRELVRKGVQVLEVDANSISLDVINKYLEIKMRQLV